MPLASGDARLGRARRARSATARPLRRSPSMSALITRASISSVTPGSVAHPRARPRWPRLRAAVWESDWTVGARTTSAAAIAAATVRGGSAACEARSEITARTASAPASAASSRRRSPRRCGRRVADHQHLLALLDAEAVAHHRSHRPLEVAHRRGSR